MKLTTITLRILLCALLISAGAIATVHAAQTPDKEQTGRTLDCEMKFTLQGMSAFQEKAKGEGAITCDNGQMANLSIRTIGGGVIFRTSEIVHGIGKFTYARTINELFGSYGQAVVWAGTYQPAAVQVMTNGRISLELVGAGRGVDFGLAFEEFTIERANEAALFRR